MFAIVAVMAEGKLRWRLADEQDGSGQTALFDEDQLVEHHVGTGEFRGMEFLHVKAKTIINEVPAASQMPFRYTINVYRGCSHSCAYCQEGETPILMADGRTKALADLRVGDQVYGTIREGNYRRYVPTPVLAHWSAVKPAYRITLADGTQLISSGDHRFLTDRGWKFVTGTQHGPSRRPHVTLGNKLIGTGAFTQAAKDTPDYRRGYLCGMIRGDGHLSVRTYDRGRGRVWTHHQFRLALADFEALDRTQRYLADQGVSTRGYVFHPGSEHRKPMRAIVTQTAIGVASIASLIEWPTEVSDDWAAGFLAGIFDAEGSCSEHVFRIANKDPAIISWTASCLRRFGFDVAFDRTDRGVTYVRIRGGLRERLRFFHLVDPAITRKRTIDGTALKSDADLRVESIESLGLDLPMFDITTGTGDFIANGVVSHNCFARPTHEYLGLNIGEDFERRIVVKVNAVELLRAELAARRWGGHHIAMGTNTDPYQRCEGKYHLTQGVVRALSEAANPFSILTKSTLILRDIDLLATVARRTEVRANFSIGTLDEDVWRLTEPGTPPPRKRVDAVRRLNDAGVPCGVLVAPVIPGLSDRQEQLEAVVSACVEAGAESISAIPLHLRPGVREHFMGWLAGARPDLVADFERRYRRAYLPSAEQRELSSRVAAIAAKTRRGRPRPSWYVRPSRTRSAAPVEQPSAGEAGPPSRQLGLGI